LDPDYVHLVEREQNASVLRSIDKTNLGDQRRLLAELGVRLSDVFGSDNVLWVEGPTEEICFPTLLDHLNLRPAATAIVAVIAPDDFGARRPRSKLTWDVYRKLSSGGSLVPPALAFSFDREGRTKAQMDDLNRASGGLVKFLPRRTYENYLLDTAALSAIIGMELRGGPSPQEVSNWITTNLRAGRYFDQTFTADSPADQAVSLVSAPQLLADLFLETTNSRLEYRKIVHSIALTKWLLANKPEHLSELLHYVRDLVPSH
jgi:hypothetical protein